MLLSSLCIVVIFVIAKNITFSRALGRFIFSKAENGTEAWFDLYGNCYTICEQK